MNTKRTTTSYLGSVVAHDFAFRKMRSSTFILSIFLLLVGCVEPYDLKTHSYTNVLVVEGHLSNIERAQQIKLSRTAPLDERVVVPEPDAVVVVESQSGEKFQFNEVAPGIYESSPFAGAVGATYKLSIKTTNGHEYESNQVMLKPVPAIGKINAEFVTAPERGIKISIDTEDPLNKTHYYRWNYIETYEIQVPFPSNYVILPDSIGPTWRYDRVDRCWGNDTLRNVLIKNTREQDHDKVIAFPLRFIPEDSYIFGIKYSMFVQQFAMSEQAYNYWNNIRILNETQGTLADVQPGAINSNVMGVTDPSETVLGYFDASAISEQRVIYDYRDFKSAGYVRPTYRSSCENNIVLVHQNDIMGYMLTRSEDYRIWDVIGMTPNVQFEVMPRPCCDCSNMGTTVKPSYWPK